MKTFKSNNAVLEIARARRSPSFLMLMAVLFAVLCFGASVSRAANSFVEGFSNFKPIDQQADSEGYTYILGLRNGSIGAIKKFDPSGGLVYSKDVTNNAGFFTPVGFCVG